MRIIIALLLLLFTTSNGLAESAEPPVDAGVSKDILIAVVPADLPPTYLLETDG